MENMIFEYIDFLLPRHNCVIVPGLGAFIVNIEPSICDKNDNIAPPVYSVIFNRELRHNDALIISYLQTTKNISYSAAYNIVTDSVKDIKQVLQQGTPVACGKLGFLKNDENGNIAFYPNNIIHYPLNFGLTPVSLQILESIQNMGDTENKRNLTIKRIASVAAIIAGVFLFVTPSANIGSPDNNIQKANFLDIFRQTVNELPSSSNVTATTDTGADFSEAINAESIIEKPERTYYIIIGGEESENQANRLLNKFQTQGFPKASIIKSDRYRIYVASFADKHEAERYLDIFRLENPQYSTAWLYSKKNVY